MGHPYHSQCQHRALRSHPCKMQHYAFWGSQSAFAAAWMNGGCRWERRKRSFLAVRHAPRQINRLAGTKPPGKTFAVLAGFCHSDA
jgi:hypothetical protein